MKALVYTEPKKLVMKDWPEPVLSAGEALVRVRAVAVCGSDIHGWLGHSRGRVPPLVLGHELAGVVEQVSDGGAGAKPGDRVAVYPLIGCDRCEYCNSGRDYICRRRKVLGLHVPGGFAELLKVPAKNLYKLQEHNNFLEGALIEPFACGVHMVGRCGDERGPIAILGGGPIGLMALQAARQQNFSKIAVAEINPNRAAQARQLGAELTVNPKDSGSFEQLEKFFGEDGCFAVFDAAGFTPTRQLALRLVRSGGVVVSAGLGDQESPLDYVDLIRREVRVEGVFAYNRRDFQTAADLIASGRLISKGWVSEAPLADGQAVFEDLINPNSSRGKVVLKP
jgi:L-gulonate 5-dehydrogenase